VTSQWFNKVDHPERGDGHDPIISQAVRTKRFALPGGRPAHVTMQRFIFTTGGAYLFQPSIAALRRLSAPAGIRDDDGGGPRPPPFPPGPRPGLV
jgi:hypothetical protein